MYKKLRMADKRKMKNEGTWKASHYAQSLHNLIAIKRFWKKIIVLQMLKQRELFTLGYLLHLFLTKYIRHLHTRRVLSESYHVCMACFLSNEGERLSLV